MHKSHGIVSLAARDRETDRAKTEEADRETDGGRRSVAPAAVPKLPSEDTEPASDSATSCACACPSSSSCNTKKSLSKRFVITSKTETVCVLAARISPFSRSFSRCSPCYHRQSVINVPINRKQLRIACVLAAAAPSGELAASRPPIGRPGAEKSPASAS